MLKKEFNYNKVRGRIKEKLKSEAKFAEKLEISQASLSAKFNNRTDFTASEIFRAADPDVLDIPLNEIGDYFFISKLDLKLRN